MNIRAFFSDVHRPFFLGGAVFTSMWLLHLLDIMPYSLPLAQVCMHMAQMIYFFFGFLLIFFLWVLRYAPFYFKVVRST